jgi:dTDP-4-dehydrorhamnose 3,5-epimerase
MKVIAAEIPDIKIIEPRVFEDERGFFLETWNDAGFSNFGLKVNFVQDNHSRSTRGILRGLHYQLEQTQGKLVRVVSGSVLDIAVDLRRSSATFGKHVALELSGENKRMVWIPPGFAHGFYVRSEFADFIYKCTDYYAPAHERCLLWNDPALGIDWQLIDGLAPILASKDAAGLPLAQCETFARTSKNCLTSDLLV